MDMTNNPAGGMSAEEMAAGLAGLPAPPLVEAPVPLAGFRWLTDVKRVESYPLASPFAIGDIEYRVIIVKRLTAGEVAAFISKLQGMSDDAPNPRYPMFFNGDVELSDEAWDAMDDDDRLALTEIMSGFLPARFRR